MTPRPNSRMQQPRVRSEQTGAEHRSCNSRDDRRTEAASRPCGGGRVVEDAALLVEGDVLRDGGVDAVTVHDVEVEQIYIPTISKSADGREEERRDAPSGTR